MREGESREGGRGRGEEGKGEGEGRESTDINAAHEGGMFHEHAATSVWCALVLVCSREMTGTTCPELGLVCCTSAAYPCNVSCPPCLRKLTELNKIIRSLCFIYLSSTLL